MYIIDVSWATDVLRNIINIIQRKKWLESLINS